jgi:hypothetical protein
LTSTSGGRGASAFAFTLLDVVVRPRALLRPLRQPAVQGSSSNLPVEIEGSGELLGCLGTLFQERAASGGAGGPHLCKWTSESGPCAAGARRAKKRRSFVAPRGGTLRGVLAEAAAEGRGASRPSGAQERREGKENLKQPFRVFQSRRGYKFLIKFLIKFTYGN